MTDMYQMARAACAGDHRWLLATYAPQLLILARTAPDEKTLAWLAERAQAELQDAVRARYRELRTADAQTPH